ncbi:MAG: hypothetical protein KGJ33_03070 [Patescibacteria group bacterium]|nr:hypothetical protein [Patescibacteria group bacterium]
MATPAPAATSAATAAADSKVKWFVLIVGIVLIVLVSLLLTGSPSLGTNVARTPESASTTPAPLTTTNEFVITTDWSAPIDVLGHNFQFEPRDPDYWYQAMFNGDPHKVTLPLVPMNYPFKRDYTSPQEFGLITNVQLRVVAPAPKPGELPRPIIVTQGRMVCILSPRHPIPYRERMPGEE